MRSECVLYRMYDASDALLYVGMSINLPSRLAQHRSQQDWWPDVVRVEVEHFAGRKAAAAAEMAAIAAEAPQHNVHSGSCVSWDTLEDREEGRAERARRVAELSKQREAERSWTPRPGAVVCTNCDRMPERMPKGRRVEEIDCIRCGCKLSRGKPIRLADAAQLRLVESEEQAA